MHRPKQGDLIPYGGIKISRQWLCNARKLRKEKKPNLEYICDSGGSCVYDSCPDRTSHCRFCWPAAYLNEIAEGAPDKYNCELVLLKTSDYPDMPDYPHIEKGEYMQFMEVMAMPRSSDSINDGWVDMWLHYGADQTPREHRLRGYVPKPFTQENLDRSYKTHWINRYSSIEVAALGQLRQEVQEELARKNKPEPAKTYSKRITPSTAGLKLGTTTKKRRYNSRQFEG
jgi:hypothetical protein